MKGLWSKFAFVLAFCIYGFIFYCISYYGLRSYAPHLLVTPSVLTLEYVTGVIAIFTVITISSYLAVCYLFGKGRR